MNIYYSYFAYFVYDNKIELEFLKTLGKCYITKGINRHNQYPVFFLLINYSFRQVVQIFKFIEGNTCLK